MIERANESTISLGFGPDGHVRGGAAAILELGATQATTLLAPDLAWFRDLGRLFVTRLCGITDLEEQRARVVVPPPTEELGALAESTPPVPGAEYVSQTALLALWSELEAAFRAAIAAHDGSVQEWLAARNPTWNLVGRVCFHLAEHKDDPEYPFAFLATYTTRLGRLAKVTHTPLRRAVELSSASGDRSALVSLLVPVRRAAEKSDLLRELLESQELFHPLAWTPAEAHRFLRDIPAFEEAGVIVRMPDWWRARRPPRLQVGVTVGGAPPRAGLGLEALLDFKVGLTLDGERISEAEWQAIASGTDGLALIKGRWVEIDRVKLRVLLEHWRTIAAATQSGLSFREGLRLLTGALGPAEEAPVEDAAEWSRLTAGDWLAGVLRQARAPEALAATRPGRGFRATLRPYQEVGVGWLAFLRRLGLGACLADDMGLGKTIQVLGLLTRLAEEEPGPHLLVVPASLVANWQAELERFAPTLRVLVAHPSVTPKAELATIEPAGADVVITTYGAVQRFPRLAETAWGTIVLDEAQAIKNPSAKQSRAVKALKGRHRIALTGTPVENRIGDLWSIFDFLNPGLLGSAAEFGRFVKKLEGGYGPLRQLVRPYILRRLKSDPEVAADLPAKTEVTAFCALSKTQAVLYQRTVEELATKLKKVEGIERRGLVLAYLLRMKQICNHPSHWLGDGGWAPEGSGKYARLRELGEAIAARQEKVLVFTQFREMCEPLAAHLADVFGRRGAVLHGQTAVKERQKLVDRFQSDEGTPFFVLSLKAGGIGLNLTAASHVIHFDRWWNPAVEAQATDRAHRIGQRKGVLVHKFVCRGTIEEKIDKMIEEKKSLARELIDAGGEKLLTELPDAEILDLVALDVSRALAGS